MSNPWASSYDALRAPYLQEKKAKKDYDGDGKVESGSKEHAGVVHNAIQRAKGGKPDGKDTRKEETVIEGSMKQARKNVGASTCWKGYKAKGTKMKNGRPVPNCVKEDETLEHIDGTKTEIVDVVRAPKMVAAPKFSNWQEEMHWEALKGKKLDVKETGVKNKVEINPSIPTEQVQYEHHQRDEDGNVIEHGDGTPASVEEGAPYTVNVADQVGNTPAYQNFKRGMKNKLTGDPLYKAGVGLDKASYDLEGEEIVDESMKQARKNVGASTCWKGYKAKGTKMKGGKKVPNCVKEEDLIEKKKGLWDNIHAKKKRMKAGSGEKKAKPGDEDYPKTLNVEAKKQYYNWREDFIWEGPATAKDPKLDVKETGVKNKIEVNPEVKTEEKKKSSSYSSTI